MIQRNPEVIVRIENARTSNEKSWNDFMAIMVDFAKHLPNRQRTTRVNVERIIGTSPDANPAIIPNGMGE